MKNELLIGLLPIKTTRLTINKTTKADIDLLLKMDKQEETQRYLGGIKNKTKEERLQFLEKKEKKFENNIASSLTVYLEEKPIGFVGLKISEEDNNAEVSYIFDLEYTRKGYATEVVEKLVDIGFNKLNLKKIIADTVKDNIPSQKVLKKLGFVEANTRKENNIEFIDFELIK